MSERIVAVNGAELWVSTQGSGPPIVLCNGGPGCCDYLEPVAAMLEDVATIYRFEPRGCGRSLPEGPYDLDTQLADLDALRQALGHERWIVGGHSWGADFALVYALTFPERTRAVISLCAAGAQNDRDWSAAYHAGNDAGLDQVPPMAFPPNMTTNRATIASYRAYIKRPSLWHDISHLDLPVLMIAGGRDIRPNWPIEQLATLLPNAQFVRFDEAGHVLWFTHAERLQTTLQAFVADIG